MPARSESVNKTIANLNNQIHALQGQNRQLNQKLLTVQTAKSTPEELFRAATMRSRKHLRTVRKLERAHSFVISGSILIAILTLILLIHVGIICFKEDQATVATWRRLLRGTYYLFADSRTGSVVNGIIGLVVSIVGQLIFPAPWRSYLAVTIFAIKQIIDIFLPIWCTVLLPVFAFMIMRTFNWDLCKQINVEQSAVSVNVEKKK